MLNPSSNHAGPGVITVYPGWFSKQRNLTKPWRKSDQMTTRTKTLLAFMDAPEGTYEVTKPTNEQLAAVLPWLIDRTVTWAHTNGHCDTVNAAIFHLVADDKTRRTGEEKYYSAAGRDCYGFDREGFRANGFDRSGFDRNGFNQDGYDAAGFNREGYSYYGYDRDGFNRNGKNNAGETREDAAAVLVKSWSPAHLNMVAAKLAELQAAKDKAAAAEAAEAVAPAEVPADEELVTAAA